MKKKQSGKKGNREPKAEQFPQTEALNHEHEKLKEWFLTVRFRKVLFGGVDEIHLWKKLEELNQRLQEPIQTETESYGLKNLHQRLRLFYGPPCGLELLANEEGGIVIRILIRRMTCAEKDSHSQS